MKKKSVFTFIFQFISRLGFLSLFNWVMLILFLLNNNHLGYTQKINFNQPNVFNYNIIKYPDFNEDTAPIISIKSVGNDLFMATKKHIYKFNNNHFTKMKFNDTKDIQWNKVELYDMITSSDKLIFSTVKHGIWQLIDGKPKQILFKNIKNSRTRFLYFFDDELMYYLPNGHFFKTQLNESLLSIPKQMELRVKQHHTFGLTKILVTIGHKLFKWTPNGFFFLHTVKIDDFQKFVALNEFFFIFLIEGKLKLFNNHQEVQINELDNYNVINLEKYDERYVIFATKNGYFALDYLRKKISKLYDDPHLFLNKKIYVDANSSIWLIENDKIVRKIEKTPFDFIHPMGIKDFNPRKIALLKSKIFVSGENKNWVLDFNYDNLEVHNLPQQNISALNVYNNQLLWLAVNNHLYVSSQLKYFYKLSMPPIFEKNKRIIQAIFQHNDNYLWVFDGVEMHQFTLNSMQSKYIELNNLRWYAFHRKYDIVNGIFPTIQSSKYKNDLNNKQNNIINIFSDENDKINVAYKNFILVKYGNYFRKIYEFNNDDLLKKAIYLPDKKATMAWTEKGIKLLNNRKIETFYNFSDTQFQPLEIILDVDKSLETRFWIINKNAIEKFIFDSKTHQIWRNQFGMSSDDFLKSESISLSFDTRKALLISDKNRIIRIPRQALDKKNISNEDEFDISNVVNKVYSEDSFDTLTVYQKYSSWILYGLMIFSVLVFFYGFRSIWKTKKINVDYVLKQKKIELLNEEEKNKNQLLLMHYLSLQLMQLNIDMLINSTHHIQLEKNTIDIEDEKNDIYKVVKKLQLWLKEKQKILNSKFSPQEKIISSSPSFSFLTFLEKIKVDLYGVYALDKSLWESVTQIEEDNDYLIFGTALESYILLLSVFSVLKKENILSMIKKIVWKKDLSNLMLNIYFFEPQFEIHTNQNLISSTYYNIENYENNQKIVDEEMSDINQVNFSKLPLLLTKITALSSQSSFIRASWVIPQKELQIGWDCKT